MGIFNQKLNMRTTCIALFVILLSTIEIHGAAVSREKRSACVCNGLKAYDENSRSNIGECLTTGVAAIGVMSTSTLIAMILKYHPETLEENIINIHSLLVKALLRSMNLKLMWDNSAG